MVSVFIGYCDYQLIINFYLIPNKIGVDLSKTRKTYLIKPPNPSGLDPNEQWASEDPLR